MDILQIYAWNTFVMNELHTFYTNLHWINTVAVDIVAPLGKRTPDQT